MATAINNQQIFDSPSKHEEELLIMKREKDKRFLKLLSQVDISLGIGTTLCSNIIDGITNTDNNNYSTLSNYSDISNYQPTISTTSQHSSFANGCDLNNNRHRVLIVPSEGTVYPYLLYSCILDGVVCKFEED
tara:strand:+ start:853 stop:1251 length:399 start_codon:yes stop_codon:yes gene_type:complete